MRDFSARSKPSGADTTCNTPLGQNNNPFLPGAGVLPQGGRLVESGAARLGDCNVALCGRVAQSALSETHCAKLTDCRRCLQNYPQGKPARHREAIPPARVSHSKAGDRSALPNSRSRGVRPCILNTQTGKFLSPVLPPFSSSLASLPAVSKGAFHLWPKCLFLTRPSLYGNQRGCRYSLIEAPRPETIMVRGVRRSECSRHPMDGSDIRVG